MKSASKIILINNEGKVLLQLRDNNHSHAGDWSLFGGHIEVSETPENALVREIKEEIGYYLKNYKLIKESNVENFGKVYWFYGIIDKKLSDLKLNEGDDFGFFTYNEILKLNISPDSKKIIIEYFENK
jgi:8-oxo-dGTP diphosphatase